MNTNARKWVTALRSGQYAQGKMVLHEVTPEGDKFCCLGLACKLYADEHDDILVQIEDEQGAAGRERTVTVYGGKVRLLPDSVCEWLGLRDTNGTFGGTDVKWDALTSMNDRGDSFDDIADVIEREPKGLFQESV